MDVIQFFKDYGSYLCAAVVVLLDILLLIVKRRPKTVDDFLLVCEEVLMSVPEMISAVEVPGNGELKKSSVIQAGLKGASKLLGRNLTEKESVILTERISFFIESVLSTPTKKGE